MHSITLPYFQTPPAPSPAPPNPGEGQLSALCAETQRKYNKMARDHFLQSKYGGGPTTNQTPHLNYLLATSVTVALIIGPTM